MRLIFFVVIGISGFLFVNGQQLKFPAFRPSGQAQTLDFGSITFQTTRPVVQASISAPAPSPAPALSLGWATIESKSTNTTATTATRDANGNSCPGGFQLRCAPRQECYGRPGEVVVPGPNDPRESATVVPVIGKPRIVNDPPTGTGCKYEELYCCAPLINPLPPPPRPPQVTCGLSYTIPAPGGYKSSYAQAAFGQYPWTSIIFFEDGEPEATGALLDERHVLTVAHKVYGKKVTKVRFGEWHIGEKFKEPYNFIEVQVASHETHHNYNPASLHNDIAILTLSRPLELHKYPHIRHVCLPNPKKNYVGHRCWVAGFGKDSFKAEYTWTRILREVDLPVMDGGECEKRLRTTHLGPYYNLNHDSFLCAGGSEERKDVCTGDGGAPLVCKVPETNQFEAVGLVAWGIDCGKPGIPGVFVNLATYVDWIQEKCKA